MKIILASSSPRRVELLKKIAPDFDVRPADIAEVINPAESIVENIERLAVEKARASHQPSELTIGADTVVVWDEQIIGKPRDKDEARDVLQKLSEDHHDVITAWCIKTDEREIIAHDIARVTFRPIPFGELEAYLAMNDPMQFAGGYAIQGAGGDFVESIDGEMETVIGLPTALLARDIEAMKKAA